MRISMSLVMTVAILLLCGVVQAAGNAAGTPEVEQLRTAYMTLYVADHDYHGHRIGAMHALEKACDLLGSDIRGDGSGHVRQAVSDADLQNAQATIAAVLQGNVVKNQHKVAKHLEKAIHEITIALKIH